MVRKNDLFINECPRDAMQGLAHFVPTETKVKYINSLLKVGFNRIDFGSFVSPKAIPQLRDTAEVIGKLELENTNSALLAIIANLRGAEQALEFEEIQFIGFPLSISEEFQKRNTNKTINEAIEELAKIQDLCLAKDKKLVVYLSMAFGNPYGERYEPGLVREKAQTMIDLGVKEISVSDTVGRASPESVKDLFLALSGVWQNVNLTAHLHSNPYQATEKIAAAWEGGCKQFDVALGGFGGCPMAEDDLVGNLSTESIIGWAKDQNLETGLNLEKLQMASAFLPQIFH
jgi:hydroxymethylglutaryl-CoA lyase